MEYIAARDGTELYVKDRGGGVPSSSWMTGRFRQVAGIVKRQRLPKRAFAATLQSSYLPPPELPLIINGLCAPLMSDVR